MATSTDLQIIQGFYLQMGGRFQTFLYDDVTPGIAAGAGEWDSVTAQPIASGDGRDADLSADPHDGRLRGDHPSALYFAASKGLPQRRAENLRVGLLGRCIWEHHLRGCAGIGVAITATFSYYWPVRFDDDVADIDQFMTNLWDWQTVKLIQVRL